MTLRTIGKKIWAFFDFVVFFNVELIKANLGVAYYVLAPLNQMEPAIIEVPLDAKTDLEVTLLANFITLTPGSMTIAVSDDKSFLYIHAMAIRDPDDFRRNIKQGFEQKILNLLRS